MPISKDDWIRKLQHRVKDLLDEVTLLRAQKDWKARHDKLQKALHLMRERKDNLAEGLEYWKKLHGDLVRENQSLHRRLAAYRSPERPMAPILAHTQQQVCRTSLSLDALKNQMRGWTDSTFYAGRSFCGPASQDEAE
jgi:hypothetical protein